MFGTSSQVGSEVEVEVKVEVRTCAGHPIGRVQVDHHASFKLVHGIVT